jgi:acetyl-CoA decarbonylase/synthase complex subunit delta
LSFEFYKESYAGAIKAISIGKGDKAITVGGETCYPLYQFEGEMPHKPKVAMEIWDMVPDEWPAAAMEPFKDVVSDPAAWAKKCVEEYGAEIIVLQLKSTDPNGTDASPADASATVKKVLGAIDVPWWSGALPTMKKMKRSSSKIAEDCQGQNLILGPVEDKNHKGIGAAAMGYGHTIISSSHRRQPGQAGQYSAGKPGHAHGSGASSTPPPAAWAMAWSTATRSWNASEWLPWPRATTNSRCPSSTTWAMKSGSAKRPSRGVDEAPTLGDPEKRGILMEAVAP